MRYQNFLFELHNKRNQKLVEYNALKKLLSILNENNIYPIRQVWESLINANCDIDKSNPCLQCSGCWKKFVQLILVIKCASGVSDRIVVAHWRKIFHSQPYCNHGLDEWNALSYNNMAALLRPCSCWIKTQFTSKIISDTCQMKEKYPIQYLK